MKKALHTLLLTAAAVGLTAGGALAANEAMNPSAPNDPAAAQTQSQTNIQTEAQTQVSAATDASQVESVQAKLKAEGYPISVDGKWGAQTADAVRQFQQANNLDASGQLNAETLAALNVDANASGGASMGESRGW